jgi:hypothetical protein
LQKPDPLISSIASTGAPELNQRHNELVVCYWVTMVTASRTEELLRAQKVKLPSHLSLGWRILHTSSLKARKSFQRVQSKGMAQSSLRKGSAHVMFTRSASLKEW